MKKWLSIFLGILILTGYLYIHFIWNYSKGSLSAPSNQLNGFHLSLNSLKPVTKNKTIDTSTFKIIVFTNLGCGQCEHLLKIVNDSYTSTPDYKRLIFVIPSFQEEMIKSVSQNFEFPIYKIDMNKVSGKIEKVPTFLLLDKSNIIRATIQGGIIVKEDLDFILKDFNKVLKHV